MLRKFKQNLVDLPKLKQVNTPTGRKYETEDGLVSFPSITHVLDKTSDKTALYEWRKRVGAERANQISLNATTRGTKMHSLCETYLINEELGELGNGPGELLFKTILPELNRLDNVRCLESRLYSESLRVAGTVDCIAELDGNLAVIDFKTSSRQKKKENIDGYFMQGCFYFTAFYEMTGELPKQISILISVQDGTTQVYTIEGQEIIHYTEMLRKRIDSYYYNLEKGL